MISYEYIKLDYKTLKWSKLHWISSMLTNFLPLCETIETQPNWGRFFYIVVLGILLLDWLVQLYLSMWPGKASWRAWLGTKTFTSFCLGTKYERLQPWERKWGHDPNIFFMATLGVNLFLFAKPHLLKVLLIPKSAVDR